MKIPKDKLHDIVLRSINESQTGGMNVQLLDDESISIQCMKSTVKVVYGSRYCHVVVDRTICQDCVSAWSLVQCLTLATVLCEKLVSALTEVKENK